MIYYIIKLYLVVESFIQYWDYNNINYLYSILIE